MASTSCFLHTYAPSTSKTPSHRLTPRPAGIVCRVQKNTQENNKDGVSRRLALTFLVGTTAVGLKVNTADAAYGDAANVFGKPKTDTEFQQYKGEGFQILIPSKWNKSKEVEFPGQVLRYEDNFDTISNVSVIIQPTDKSKITDYGSPEEFLGKFDYLLGKQTFFGKTDSEGGFESSAVATANILETDTPVIKGNQYYLVSVLARTADGNEGGKHQLITATVKDGKLYICRAQAGDKRWFKGARKSVETAANSFNVA